MANSPYTIKIGGALVNVLSGSLNVVNQIGQRSSGSIKVWGPLGTLYQYGTSVQVFDDVGALVYSGFTMKDKVRKFTRQGTGFLEHDITLMDNCYKADKRVIFGSYLNTSAGAIVQSLVGKVLSAEGVTYTAASIAAGPLIQEAIWNGKRISDALNWLAKQSGFWWNIDVNSVLHFQPYGGTPAPFILDGTQAETETVTVEAGNDVYVNKQFTRGAFATKGTKANPLDESIHGDGVRRSFTLSYEVANVYQILVNGVDVTSKSLTKGSTGGQYYFAKGDATIAQDVSQTILGSGDTLRVIYSGRLPVLAVAQNPALIASQKAREGSGSSGIVESVYVNTKVHSLSAAFQIAGSLLTHYGQDTTIVEFETRQKGLQQGQMLTVNLSDFNLNNRQMLISDVGISDQGSQDSGVNIWFHVKAVGSPVESAQWQTYWQNLMNQSSDPSDFTDATDTSLALLLASTVVLSWSGTVTKTTAVCPIFSNSTLFSNTTVFC